MSVHRVSEGVSGHAANLPRSLGLSVCLCYVSRATFVCSLAMRMSTGRKALGNEANLQRVRTTPTIQTPPHLLYVACIFVEDCGTGCKRSHTCNEEAST